jgi:hypothetical protein
VLLVQKQVTTNTTKQLRLGDEVEMGNSLFRIALVVPNPEDEDEATKTVTDDNEIAQLQKDYEMGDIAGADDGGDDVGDYQSEDENDIEEEEVEDPVRARPLYLPPPLPLTDVSYDYILMRACAHARTHEKINIWKEGESEGIVFFVLLSSVW